MLAILLSHHRTGSTAIQQALAARVSVCPDEPLLFPISLASPHGEHFQPFAWPAFLKWCSARYRLVHFHREHIDMLSGWESIAEHGAAVIHLTRQTLLHQALSYERALRDGVWKDHPRGHSHGDAIDLDALSRHAMAWAVLEAKAECYFRELPALHVSYEDFESQPFPTIERIVGFVESHR